MPRRSESGFSIGAREDGNDIVGGFLEFLFEAFLRFLDAPEVGLLLIAEGLFRGSRRCGRGAGWG